MSLQRNLFLLFLMTILTLTAISCREDMPEPLGTSGITYVENTDNEQETTQVPIEATENAIIRFTPLADNEQFALSLRDMPQSPIRPWSVMTLFAMHNNDFKDVSVLFSREPIPVEHIQMASNFKKCFFIEFDWREPTGLVPYKHAYHHLYMANGFTGEIRRLLTTRKMITWRVSHDGRFILFLEDQAGGKFTHLSLFDVESEIIVVEFEWRPYRIGASPIEAWEIHRFENIFRISGIGEGGFVLAVAEFDLIKMKLRSRGDFLLSDLSWLPNVEDEGWFDDIFIRNNIPPAMLQ